MVNTTRVMLVLCAKFVHMISAIYLLRKPLDVHVSAIARFGTFKHWVLGNTYVPMHDRPLLQGRYGK